MCRQASTRIARHRTRVVGEAIGLCLFVDDRLHETVLVEVVVHLASR